MSDDIFQRLRELDEIEKQIKEARKAEEEEQQIIEQHLNAGYSRLVKLKQERPALYEKVIQQRGQK